MSALLVIIVVFLALASTLGLVIYFHSRRLLREQKNFERGLKMVPLLIHLPPPSEDTEGNGRDVRDVTEETISKAQVLYNIIASTLKKGFKSKFYGQRHFAFEIVGSKGFVHFYAAVPVTMVEVVQQAIVSSYPAARLEEVAEHNIFSPVGRISGTIGGELTLKESFAYPIATYQDLKRDAMQALLNALSTLDKEDGVGIQILLRPADPSWRKKATAIAGKKRKGKEGKKGAAKVGSLVVQGITALNKPPEDKGDKGSDKPELSAIEQSIVDAIDDKTRHPGYEVLIRVIASSNIAQRSQAILNNIIATFALFDAPGRNGFKYTPAKDIERFVTAYILRFFPQESSQNILNAVELATIFHFPDQQNVPTTQLERQASKQVDGPRNIAEEGMLLGYNVFRGVKKPIRITDEDRRRHVYIVGQTGTGKSTFMENLILQDMLQGRGFAFIDPHGDAAERILSMVPRERTEDVIYFCPSDMDYPLGLNLFEFDTPDQKDFLIQEAIAMLYKLYDPQHQGIIGPRYEHWFRNAALTVMANPEGGTFIDIPKVFTDKQYERQLKQYVTDQTVLDFWNKEMAATSDYHKSEVLGWFVSKFGAFLSNEMMRNVIGQQKSAFNLRQIMDEGKILLVNLSKGRSGELNSKLLGMIFVMKFQAAAMSRATLPEDQRRDFTLYVDEFQNFSTESFADILSEARKYGLTLTVANQFTTQLSDEIRDAVFGNVGSIASFRVGTNDAEFLAKQFAPIFDSEDLQRLPNYNTVVRMLISGVPAQPFSMATMPPLGTTYKQLAQALKQLSAAKFGRPKAIVEKEIFDRLRTKEEPRPAFGTPSGGQPLGMPPAAGQPLGAAPAPGARPAMPASGSSFLDEWLTKRRTTTPPAPGNPFAAGPNAPRPVSGAPGQPFASNPLQTPASSPTGSPAASPFATSGSLNNIQPSFNPNAFPSTGLPSGYTSPTTPPPLQPTPAPPPSTSTPSPVPQNISSNELDKQEVTGIADELKQTLESAKPTPASTPPTSGEISLRTDKSETTEAAAEDTIFIDQEGHLQPKSPAPKDDAPA